MNQLGYFGKTRHRGDFVRFNLPQSFSKVWDDWLQQIILDAEQRHPDDWKDLYDNAPSQRFVLSSGVAGGQMWIGILLPSQDKVGRRFPFCLAMSLPENHLPCVSAARLTPWFTDANTLLTRMQSPGFDFDQLQTELGQLAEKYEQTELPSSPLHHATPNPDSDAIAVSVTSSDPLNNPVTTQALLDGLLTQTLGEYSLWMAQDGSNQSLLHAGLPTGESALALLCAHSQVPAPTHIDLAVLGIHVATSDTLPILPSTKMQRSIDSTVGIASENQPPEAQSKLTETADEPVGEARLADARHHSSGASHTDNDLNATNEYEPLDANTLEQSPSADDWAALDDFAVGERDQIKVTIPEVEPLELDEDESADIEDAPWET